LIPSIDILMGVAMYFGDYFPFKSDHVARQRDVALLIKYHVEESIPACDLTKPLRSKTVNHIFNGITSYLTGFPPKQSTTFHTVLIYLLILFLEIRCWFFSKLYSFRPLIKVLPTSAS